MVGALIDLKCQLLEAVVEIKEIEII
jgi:hypothetical protein